MPADARIVDDLGRDGQHVARLILEATLRDARVDLFFVRDDAFDERTHRAVVGEEGRLLLDVVLRLVVHVADADDRASPSRSDRGSR